MASIQRRPDGKWRVRYRDPAGSERSKHFERKFDAERFRATIQTDVLRGNYLDPDAGKVLFTTFSKKWLAGVERRPPRAHLWQPRAARDPPFHSAGLAR